MALDPQIALMVKPSNIVDAAQQGLQFGQQFALRQSMAPIQQQAAQAEADMQAARASKLQTGNKVAAARMLHDAAAQLKTIPLEQRAAVAQKAFPQLQQMGIDTSVIDLNKLDDASLDSDINALKPLTIDQSARVASSHPVGNETFVDRSGTTYSQTRVFDPRSNKVNLIETALGPTKTITNRMGQTADDQFARAVELKRQQESIAAYQALNIAGGKASIDIGSAAQIEAEKKAAEQRSVYKTQAVAAAENIPTLERAIDLNSKVITGGGPSVLQAAANYLGIASSDPGELRSLLNQNILGQLKSTFGGNPTEGERAALGQAQASFNQSGYVNKALLDNALKLARLRVQRGKQAAIKDKDAETLKYINDSISVKLGEEEKPQPKGTTKTEAAKEVNWSDL